MADCQQDDEERRLESCKNEEDAKTKDTNKPGTTSSTLTKLENKLKMENFWKTWKPANGNYSRRMEG